MELRAITSIDELTGLVSSLTFDEFYQKVVEENQKYEEEYYEALKTPFFQKIEGLKMGKLRKIIYKNWAIFRKIVMLSHLARGIKHPNEYYQEKLLWSAYESNKYPSHLDETADMRPFFNIAKDIYDNIEQYKSVYELLEDKVSKNVLMGRLVSRLTGDIRHLTDLTSKNPQYFDDDIIKAYADEVVVDAGGFTGDTVQVLLETPEANGKIKRIYLYEPNRNNIEQAKKNLSSANAEIVFRMAGVSNRHDNLCITDDSSGSRITGHGQKLQKIEVVALDEDIEERLTFIKMDIEGSERAALQGCQKHIREDAPKLAICVYHKIDDVWRIARCIQDLHSEYKFYLRHYSPLGMGETVMYCLP